VTSKDRHRLSIGYNATIYENKEKWEERQNFSMNLQTQGVKMDHPQTQRIKLAKIRQAKRK
jgi:hypothetical protein